MQGLNPDISAKCGGKVIFYRGTGDGIFSIFDTIFCLDQVDSVMDECAAEFIRLYAVRQMTHCSAARPPPRSIPCRRWSTGRGGRGAHRPVIATPPASNGLPANRTRPICPYP
jgi:hypothetical protein